MKKTNFAAAPNLVLLPPSTQRGEQPVRKKKTSIAYVRKSLRNQANGFRNAAYAMFILAGLIVLFFCSCNGIAKDIYVSLYYLAFNTIDETGGMITSVIFIVIGLLFGGFMALIGIFLRSSSESLIEEAKKLNKEV